MAGEWLGRGVSGAPLNSAPGIVFDETEAPTGCWGKSRNSDRGVIVEGQDQSRKLRRRRSEVGVGYQDCLRSVAPGMGESGDKGASFASRLPWF